METCNYKLQSNGILTCKKCNIKMEFVNCKVNHDFSGYFEIIKSKYRCPECKSIITLWMSKKIDKKSLSNYYEEDYDD